MKRKDNIDIALIKRYLKGELTAPEMHALERRAQQDPLLLDLMIGMEKAMPQEADAHVSDIRQLINRRVAGNTSNARNTRRIWVAAASVLLALVIGAWWLKNKQSEVLIVAEKSVPEKQPAPHVSKAPKVDSTPLIAATPTSKKPVKKTTRRKPNASALASRTASATSSPVDSQAHLLAGRAVALEKKDTVKDHKSEPVLLSGVITDKTSRKPLSGVKVSTVRGANQAETTETDPNGRFALSVPDDNKTLAVSSLGYKNQQIALQDEDSLRIAMIPDNSNRNEVERLAYGARQKKTSVGHVQPMQTRESPGNSTIPDARTVAEPLIGWKAYDSYLNDAARSLDGSKGVVTVAFRIDEEGKPIDVMVIKGLTDQTNEQAIAIIRNGAKWEHLPGNIMVKLVLTFK